MGRLVNVHFQGKDVEGEELVFKPVNELWNEYTCDDGSFVRVRLVVSKITKLVKDKNEAGQPIYVLETAAIVSATAPPLLSSEEKK